MGQGSAPRDSTTVRNQIEFYLLDHETRLGQAIDVALLALNLAFVAIFVAQSYPLAAATETALWRVEIALALVFAVEYFLRLYGAPNRLEEATDFYTTVDLLSILPTFAVVFVPDAAWMVNVGFLRALRVIRILRFYRFTRDEEFFFGSVSVEALRVAKLVLTVFVIFFTAAGLFYSAEVAANPGIANFGDAFYYVVIALATVGFGDIVPVTELGRWITVGAVIAAIILIPGQAGKIVREWSHRDTVQVSCPNCGLEYHDPDASHCKACGHVIYQEHDSRE
ncbi:MAG: ion transporter [Halanaeroarchaeum sp.]